MRIRDNILIGRNWVFAEGECHIMSVKVPLRQTAEILATNDIHQKTMAEIAEECKVSERTIYRWKQESAFIEYQMK
jgi:hypothetical protein